MFAIATMRTTPEDIATFSVAYPKVFRYMICACTEQRAIESIGDLYDRHMEEAQTLVELQALVMRDFRTEANPNCRRCAGSGVFEGSYNPNGRFTRSVDGAPWAIPTKNGVETRVLEGTTAFLRDILSPDDDAFRGSFGSGTYDSATALPAAVIDGARWYYTIVDREECDAPSLDVIPMASRITMDGILNIIDETDMVRLLTLYGGRVNARLDG